MIGRHLRRQDTGLAPYLFVVDGSGAAVLAAWSLAAGEPIHPYPATEWIWFIALAACADVARPHPAERPSQSPSGFSRLSKRPWRARRRNGFGRGVLGRVGVATAVRRGSLHLGRHHGILKSDQRMTAWPRFKTKEMSRHGAELEVFSDYI